MKLFDTFRNTINSFLGSFQYKNEDYSNETEIILKENEDLKKQLEEMQNKCKNLEDINLHIRNKLAAYQEAKDKGCKKGDYCQICAFGHKNFDYISIAVNSVNSFKTAEYYVCEFDCCKHFVRKDQEATQ